MGCKCECPTLEERIAGVEKNPHDHRNRPEYRRVFEAVREIRDWDERNQLVDYACEILGITDDSRYVYQWMLTTHANFGHLCHEGELTCGQKIFFKIHDLVGRHIMLRFDKTPRDDEFPNWLKAAHDYIVQKPVVKLLYVKRFYNEIAPLVINKLDD